MKCLKTILLYLLCFFANPTFAKADTVDNYQIYKNKKLILNDSGFGSMRAMTNLLYFSKKDLKDTLFVNFNHCTSDAFNRNIRLVNKSGKVFFRWVFPNKDIQDFKELPIIEMWNIANNFPNEELHLYYYDKQLPEGAFLTSIRFKNK